MTLNARIGEVTERIRRRSESGRAQYLDRIRDAARQEPHRRHMSCSNLAHGFAGCAADDSVPSAAIRRTRPSVRS